MSLIKLYQSSHQLLCRHIITQLAIVEAVFYKTAVLEFSIYPLRLRLKHVLRIGKVSVDFLNLDIDLVTRTTNNVVRQQGLIAIETYQSKVETGVNFHHCLSHFVPSIIVKSERVAIHVANEIL